MYVWNASLASGERRQIFPTESNLYIGCSDVSELEHIYGQINNDAILCVQQIVYMNKNGGF